MAGGQAQSETSDGAEAFCLPRTVTPECFRAVLASVATPVSVVTSLRDGHPHGTTVNAFCSLSLHPPLVLVALDHSSDLLRTIRASGRFAINVLDRTQAGLARRFAQKGQDRFDGVEWEEAAGLPRLGGCTSWLACRFERAVPSGDHMIVVGLVLEAERRDAEPLVYRDRAFGTITLW